ncbi:MAG: PUA domain-containing protein [Thermoplasmata archaeon]
MRLKPKKRHRLRRKEVRRIAEEIERALGCQALSDSDSVDTASLRTMDIIYVNGEVLGLIVEERPFLSVRGLLACCPKNRYVTVDMGAVEFVYNGADVMAPGVVDADPSISEGDLAWVRDERNLQPLAVGVALMSGREMVNQNKGKALESLHHVGDALWKMDED